MRLSLDVATRAGFDARPFERLVQHARREVQIPVSDVTAILTSALDAMGRLVAFRSKSPWCCVSGAVHFLNFESALR